LSDVAYLLPRCPRCGYGLRRVRGYWWCDVCKAILPPQEGPSIRKMFQAAREGLRRFLSSSRRRRGGLTYAPTTVSMPQTALARCPSCRALTPRDMQFCVHCGTRFAQPVQVSQVPTTPPARLPQGDDLVYRYIVGNRGEISLSKASTDLGMALPELQAAIQRLEGSGKIMRDRSRDSG
jgi:ribosomal protein L37AE/L43A